MAEATTRSATQRWIGQTLRGKYRIVGRLGEGGWGAVFEAEHLLLGRRVAIKVLHADVAADPTFLQRFRREALAASRIGHPNIVEVIDLDRTDDGMEFMVLELLRGRDLAQEIEAVGKLPRERALTIFTQVASALGAAHRIGIVHRDLKPENVFLVARPGEGDLVKLVDFGIAKVDGLFAEAQVTITRTGAVLGTPYYMPPEQLRGEKTIDHRADLYSLGVLFYESLAGHPPFEAPNLPALVTKVLFEEPVPLERARPDLPQELGELVRALMRKEAAERPQSCDEVLAALAALPSGEGRRAPIGEDEETIVATTASMDDALDDLDTIVMPSASISSEMPSIELALAASGERSLDPLAPSIRIAPELAHASRSMADPPERSVGPSNSATTVRPPALARDGLRMLGIAAAFLAIVALSYWVVMHL